MYITLFCAFAESFRTRDTLCALIKKVKIRVAHYTFPCARALTIRLNAATRARSWSARGTLKARFIKRNKEGILTCNSE